MARPEMLSRISGSHLAFQAEKNMSLANIRDVRLRINNVAAGMVNFRRSITEEENAIHDRKSRRPAKSLPFAIFDALFIISRNNPVKAIQESAKGNNPFNPAYLTEKYVGVSQYIQFIRVLARSHDAMMVISF
ncbi:MAG: hypothetical protein K0M69_16140 [Youngiibacter sp.]|nr:hypothetical protein [Youngiibacter sp.]